MADQHLAGVILFQVARITMNEIVSRVHFTTAMVPVEWRDPRFQKHLLNPIKQTRGMVNYWLMIL